VHNSRNIATLTSTGSIFGFRRFTSAIAPIITIITTITSLTVLPLITIS